MAPLHMAILTSTLVGGPVPAPHWPQRSTFQEIIQIGREMGMEVFVSCPQDFDWQRRQVAGYTYFPGEGGRRPRWVRRRYPLPDVVYNRIPSRAAEAQPLVQACLRRMARRIGPALFNPSYLDKASVFRILARDPDLAPYLPPTRSVRSWADVETMLARHRRVYLKPSRGSLGDYTADITAGGRGGRYRYRYNLRRGRTRTGFARHLGEVRRALAPLLDRRSYIVQAAVDLARLDGRPFDLRVLVQKDGTGAWVYTGAAARVAGPGQITTHVPRGGSRASLAEALSAFPPEVALRVEGELQSMAVAIARAVEAGTGRAFAEFSMDIGADRQGRLWLFEVNSKPLRFDEDGIRRLVQERMLSYAQAVSGGQGRQTA